MRWALIPVYLLWMAFPSWAAKRMTVAQLEQALIADSAAHKSDAEIARKLNSTELSERLTDVTLGRLNKHFPSGSRSAMALLLLADRSAFLEPPARELPSMPAPDAAAQQHLMQAAQRFALETLPRLPNLLATRTTFSFDDSPQEGTNGGYLERLGLHLVSSLKTAVSVHDEREKSSTSAGPAPSQVKAGLTTWGEFGSALLIILSDSSQGKTTWSHWERTSAGLMAVFHYEVSRSASHYEIDTPIEEIQTNGGSNRWARTGGVGAITVPATNRMRRSKPGYEGSLWIDPATGTITRLTLVADLKGNPALEHAAILVEYGPVHIADKTLICPVRSLALSSAPPSVKATLEGAATEWLNENLFTSYHLFASTSRILPEEATSVAPQNPPKQRSASAAAGSEPEPLTTPVDRSIPSPEEETVASQPQSPAADQPPAERVAKSAPMESPNQGVTTPAMPKSPENPPAIEPATSSSSVPVTSLQRPSPVISEGAEVPDSGMTMHVNVNSVLVPVVVRDGHGHIVDDLQKQDFAVFDDNKPHPLSGFLVERRAPDSMNHERSPTSEAVPQAGALPGRVTVFIYDDMHLTLTEIARVQNAALKSLDGALTGSDMAAVVSTSGKINSGLTRDRAKLASAIMALRPIELYRSNEADCPKVDYYQADLIVNKHDLDALQDATRQVLTCNPNLTLEAAGNLAQRIAESTAMRTLQLGEQDVLTTYEAIGEYVRRMAKLPGQHTMILVSPGFLPIEEAARNAESRLINLAADSSVTINALDACGLYATSATASKDVRNRNPTQLQDYRQNEMGAEENSMGELADATGGTFFHNNNDLEAGFAKLLEVPETLYMLELPLDGVKPDGAYHGLSVKIDRADLHVQARRGYFAPIKSRSGQEVH